MSEFPSWSALRAQLPSPLYQMVYPFVASSGTWGPGNSEDGSVLSSSEAGPWLTIRTLAGAEGWPTAAHLSRWCPICARLTSALSTRTWPCHTPFHSAFPASLLSSGSFWPPFSPTYTANIFPEATKSLNISRDRLRLTLSPRVERRCDCGLGLRYTTLFLSLTRSLSWEHSWCGSEKAPHSCLLSSSPTVLW